MSQDSQQLSTSNGSEELIRTPDSSQQTHVTRSPSILSTALSSKRKRQRVDNFFKGKARAAYGLSPMLEQSLSSSENSFRDEDGLEEVEDHCKRGCTEILRRLKGVFEAVGRHNTKTYTTYAKSNPNPKKQTTAYRNLTGEDKCVYICVCGVLHVCACVRVCACVCGVLHVCMCVCVCVCVWCAAYVCVCACVHACE